MFSAQLSNQRRRYAQTFSAANNADGSQATFDFDGVTFVLTGSSTRNLAASHLVVTVNTDNSGEPGSVMYTLTSATTSLSLHVDDRREFTFNAPAGTTLTSGVTYWIVFAPAPGSDYFDRNYIIIYITSDDGEVQGTATVNHWSIGDTSLYDTGSATSQTEQRVLMVAVLGLQHPPVLVSNLGRASVGEVEVRSSLKGAQSFVAGPGLVGIGYRFQGIRVTASADISDEPNVGPLIPRVRAGLHRHAGGLPGSLLHTLTVSDDFASTEEYMDYTLSAPPGTVLAGGARYWVVFEVLTINNLYLRTTTSPDEDQVPPPVDGWRIDDERYAKNNAGWQSRPRAIKLAVLGSPLVGDRRVRRPRPPGCKPQRPPDVSGIVIPGIVSTGHLTAGLDYDHGHSGDYWWLETQTGPQLPRRGKVRRQPEQRHRWLRLDVVHRPRLRRLPVRERLLRSRP